jgi:predicted transposase/invertase (TIGR01784 family)
MRKDSPLTWWIEFFKNPHSDVVKEIGKFEPTIKEAVKMFDIAISDPETQELIRMKDKGLRDYNSAVKNAEKRGRNEGKREMIIKMLRREIAISDIADLTELSEQEILQIKMNNQLH